MKEPRRKTIRADWQLARRIVRAINTLGRYEAAGCDGIFPTLFQEGMGL